MRRLMSVFLRARVDRALLACRSFDGVTGARSHYVSLVRREGGERRVAAAGGSNVATSDRHPTDLRASQLFLDGR